MTHLLTYIYFLFYHIKVSEWVADNEDTVNTQYGPIVGAVYKTARAFYAIPYAKPPLGIYFYRILFRITF